MLNKKYDARSFDCRSLNRFLGLTNAVMKIQIASNLYLEFDSGVNAAQVDCIDRDLLI